ncbi:Mov34/MPN/PAD-1 family protein [Marispirochaeta aestuarii]|uniref:Mov34/MPN/PAD-1 family protein n=1 Tax=Marispirochaeta aestuarii TaxID=1963862 RepID=UPI0029C626FB|nr:Mov34/MPN/PAD-1 family protein [Marispirochaeta aestuarii]
MFTRIRYKVPDSIQYISISPLVEENLNNYIQIASQPESGGLLFAEFKLPEIHIADISVPYENDIKRMFLFIPDQKHQQHVIKKKFQKGLHFVGEWHTHPQNHPEPSQLDIYSMRDSFRSSSHELNYFIMLILGNTKDFDRSWVSIHNGETYIKLEPERKVMYE